MLERALKRVEEIRQPERERKERLLDMLGRAGAATQEVYRTGMREQIAAVKQAVYDLLDKRLAPEELLRQIARWERDWAPTMANRVTEALIRAFREDGVASDSNAVACMAC